MGGKKFGKKEAGCKLQELSRELKRAKQRAAEQLCAQKTTGMEGAPDFDLKKLKSVNQH